MPTPPFQRIRLISRDVLVYAAVCCGAWGYGCSAGESGLVLGRPLAAQGGSAGAGSLPNPGAEQTAGHGGAAGTDDGTDPSWIGEACTPVVTFQNRDSSSKGQLFTDAVPDPARLIHAASHAACRTLFRAASEVKAVSNVSLVVEDYAGIASTTGTSIRLSSNHLQSTYDEGQDVAREIAGILHFTTSLVYQSNAGGTAPTWLVTGIADFVRLEAGLIDRAARVAGGTYQQSSQATAFFLEYLTTRNLDIVYQLNRRLLPGSGPWSDDAFIALMGSDLDTLWAEYQATF